jgi:protein SCO1
MKSFIGIAGVIIMLAACRQKQPGKLQIYGQREAVTKTVNGKEVTDTLYHTIPDFKMVNQQGDSITSKSVNGKIYVADFFFTTCPSICPIMHRNMLNVYKEFKDVNDFKILSYSIDPKHDSVPVLKKYADKLGIRNDAWWLLQGSKEETYKLAGDYLTAVAEDGRAPGGYVHQGYFILVDKQKRIRGTYDGTKPEQVKQLIADVKILRAEPEQSTAE